MHLLLFIGNFFILWSLVLVFKHEVARYFSGEQLGENWDIEGVAYSQRDTLHPVVLDAIMHHNVWQSVVNCTGHVLSNLLSLHRSSCDSESVVWSISPVEISVLEQVVDCVFQMVAFQLVKVCWAWVLLQFVEGLSERLAEHLVHSDVREEKVELIYKLQFVVVSVIIPLEGVVRNTFCKTR